MREWFMKLETGFTPDAPGQPPSERLEHRRSGIDRRADFDRRRSRGLFEVRARKERIAYDRRRGERREQKRSWLMFWRRDS
jgi:hypothetical protein